MERVGLVVKDALLWEILDFGGGALDEDVDVLGLRVERGLAREVGGRS